MTDQQEKIYNLIITSIANDGFAMSNLKIADKLGKHRQIIDKDVNLLVAMGKLKKLKPGLIVLPD